MTSGWIRAIREHLKHLKSTQRAREQSDFIIPSEPKILRLVFSYFVLCLLYIYSLLLGPGYYDTYQKYIVIFDHDQTGISFVILTFIYLSTHYILFRRNTQKMGKHTRQLWITNISCEGNGGKMTLITWSIGLQTTTHSSKSIPKRNLYFYQINLLVG